MASSRWSVGVGLAGAARSDRALDGHGGACLRWL